jgi:hypothetical protein
MAYTRYAPEHNQTKSYVKLMAICPTVAQFDPIPNQRVGPTIRILQVPANVSAEQGP